MYYIFILEMSSIVNLALMKICILHELHVMLEYESSVLVRFKMSSMIS